jgi:predicted dienelactone hydrolase
MTLTYDPPSGPYAVGVRDGEVLDRTYAVMRPEDGDGRRLAVRVWYPASERGEPRRYVVRGESQVLAWFAEINGCPPEWATELAGVTTHSVEGAPALNGPFPTVVFSHGASSWVSQNTPLMEHLASHGYVVWSVAHPGEACGVHYPDGDLVRGDVRFHESFAGLMTDPRYLDKLTGDVATRLEVTPAFLDDKGMGPWAQRWVDDLRAVIDALEAGSMTGAAAELVEAIDLSRLGTAGMSFGAAAATSTAQQDPRVRAALNLDGGQHLSDLLDTDVRVPLLHLASDIRGQLEGMGVKGVTTVDANEFFFEPLKTAGTRKDVQRMQIADVTHLELTDLVLLPAEQRAVLPMGGRVESQRTIDLLNAFIHAFFDATLQGRDTGLPTGTFPEVTPIDVSPIREWAQQP